MQCMPKDPLVGKRYGGRGAFTLLELIVVVIIVGVLATLAVISLRKVVQFSYATEALYNMGFLRKELNHCYIAQNQDYTDCAPFLEEATRRYALAVLQDEDAPVIPDDLNGHFAYTTTIVTDQSFRITARRTKLDGGDGTSKIKMAQDSSGLIKSGTGIFKSIH